MSTFVNACVLALMLCLVADASAAERGSPGAFRDCAECPQMVVVPAGVFVMGGKPEPRINFKPEPDEIPQRSVSVRSFALGKYEVTQAEWRAVMGENPSDYDDGSGVLPVETVSWSDAQEYARRLSIRTGRQYRLPTEAEWEYAARAGSTGLFSFGDDIGELGQYAWYGENSGGHIHPVGLKLANAFGLYDMHGNVWEWVEDCYESSYAGAPADGTAMPKAPPCQRNNRGGSWVNSPLNLRSHHRHKMGAGSRGTFVGMRVAATPGEAGSRPISK